MHDQRDAVDGNWPDGLFTRLVVEPNLFELIHVLQEKIDQLWVPEFPGSPLKNAGCLFSGHAFSVGTITRHGVERIADCQDASVDRNVLASKTVRIAFSAVVLVMIKHARQNVLESFQFMQNAPSGICVSFDDGSFVIIESPRFL